MTWPTENYQLFTGSYSGIDGRFIRRGKKRPIGFAPPKPKKPKKSKNA